jgi:hypothetical protein
VSTIKSSAEDLTLNADGSGNDIKFQSDGVEKASISSAGLLTSTTIDATALTGNLPAIDGSNLTGVAPTKSVVEALGISASSITGALPAISGASLTALNATNLDSGTVSTARLGTGTADAGSFLRGDNTWATPTDTNTTYSAGAGLDLSTTTFSVESDLRSDVQYIGQDTNDYYYVNTTSHDWYLDGVLDMRLENDGDLHADGDVIAYSTTTASDRKLKDNITTVEDALDKVKQLNGVEFTWKKDGKKSAGVIAQDVEKVLPQAVKIVKDLNSNDEYKTVKYDALISILVESIKELSARVEELESK